jgi:hypothetical protein
MCYYLGIKCIEAILTKGSDYMHKKKEIKLARAYVPYQPYVRLYPLPEALMKGTIFPNLYQPYIEKKTY